MPRLALLRHGHTAWNRAGRIQGRTDVPLDEAARAQLRGLRMPAPWDKADLCSSPLLRAVETARLVTGQEPMTDPALIEMDWGQWEGCMGRDLVADAVSGFRHIEEWGWDYSPPDGESPAIMRARLHAWAEMLTRDTVAVCHIGVMRVLMAQASGWNFNGAAPFHIKRNRLYVLDISESKWQLDPQPQRLEDRSA